MAKLTKAEAKMHAEAERILAQERLSDDDREFVYTYWHEAANHVNTTKGAFFTPIGLAGDFAIEPTPGRIIDLGAGIGVLSYCVWSRFRYTNSGVSRMKEFVCIEANPAYVEVGKKLFPEARWVCGDIFDVPGMGLGEFGCALSNPPFGATPRNGKGGPRYTGKAFEYHVIDLASDIADYGVFIIPQNSAPFVYSGAQYYRDRESDDYRNFARQTCIHLESSCGIDTTYRDGPDREWKGVAPRVEIVVSDFEGARDTRAKQSGTVEQRQGALL